MAYFQDTTWNEWDLPEEDADVSVDPLDSLSRREQDTFFRVLDMLPEGTLEAAMEYFLSHPKKIRAVLDYVKVQKELIKKHDTEALKELFERENIVIEELSQKYAAEAQEVNAL